MHFPIERFGSLDYDARASAMSAWFRMKDFRSRAIRSRKWQWMIEAEMAHNSAILAIRDVKYWAEKAKEKNHV